MEDRKLRDVKEETLESIHETASAILKTLCRANGETHDPITPKKLGDNPRNTARFNLFFALRDLSRVPPVQDDGYPFNEAQIFSEIHRALPSADEDLALIFVWRALKATNLADALEELRRAQEWASRAVLANVGDPNLPEEDRRLTGTERNRMELLEREVHFLQAELEREKNRRAA